MTSRKEATEDLVPVREADSTNRTRHDPPFTLLQKHTRWFCAFSMEMVFFDDCSLAKTFVVMRLLEP